MEASTVFQCCQRGKDVNKTLSIVHCAQSERLAIDWLQRHGGGVYRNTLHNFQTNVEERVYVEIFYDESDNDVDSHYEVNIIGAFNFDGDTFDELIDAEDFANEIASAERCIIKRINC